VLALVLAGRVRASLETAMVFPGSASQGKAYAVPPSDGRETVVLHLADGTLVVGEFGTALAGPKARSRTPTVLFFYGNGACAATMEQVFQGYRRIGMNILIVDYPGYGMSGGKPSEQGCYAAADAAWEWSQHRTDIDPSRVVAAGWSLGSAVAIHLAGRHPVCALETVSAFTTLPDVGHYLYPWLPVSLLLRSHFDNEEALPKSNCPVLLVHGTSDTLVPVGMQDALAALVPVRGSVLKIDGAGHNDVFSVGGERLWSALDAAVP
jgi:uncharacterized protein